VTQGKVQDSRLQVRRLLSNEVKGSKMEEKMLRAGDYQLRDAIGQRLMVSFEGYSLPESFEELLRRRHVGGVTLFRANNVWDPAQVRELTGSLQRAAEASGQPPLLIGVDQEGGTLLALAGTTPFPGNMALGATRSPELARRVGLAVGRELAAVGINVNYAPVCDVNINPRNPVIGTRSFGGEPEEVAGLAGAMVEGLQEAGVAATAKHFPGHGDTSSDSHHALPVLPFDEERLLGVELPPFASAIKAGVKLVMSAHISLPGLTGDETLPATLSPQIMEGLLRGKLGFGGVSISDAMDMGGVHQGRGQAAGSMAAAAAGVDLIMLMDSGETMESVYEALVQATERGDLSLEQTLVSVQRVLDLKAWVRAPFRDRAPFREGGFTGGRGEGAQPGLEVVGCEEHRALAYEVGARAVTLVRDDAGILPLRVSGEERVLAVVPRPADLTPADTSSYDTPRLAEALRAHHSEVDEVIVPLNPGASYIAALVERARGYAVTIVGTINAHDHEGQADLVDALLSAGIKVVTVALRLPYDIKAYPAAPTYVCTYSLQAPSLAALADALFGRIPFAGKLPVSLDF
jgi:beta-N-acetylhexosaminidase